MSRHQIFLGVIGLVALCSALLGIYNSSVGNFSGVAWPFVWIGVFIWGDGIILGVFLLLSSAWLWFKNDPIFTGMFFPAYVALRSFIEIIYNLNAQFTTTTRPWENFVPALAASLHLTTTEFFVLPQLIYTVVCLIAVLIFVSYLKKYMNEPRRTK